MSNFAIIDSGRAGFKIVPLTPEGNAYISHCRGMLAYSKRTIAKAATKRMEESLKKRVKPQ